MEKTPIETLGCLAYHCGASAARGQRDLEALSEIRWTFHAGDGHLDLAFHVSTEAVQLSPTDTIAVLEGTTFTAQGIWGTGPGGLAR